MLKSIIRLPRFTDVYILTPLNILLITLKAYFSGVLFYYLVPLARVSSMGNLPVISLRIIITDNNQIIKVFSSMIS